VAVSVEDADQALEGLRRRGVTARDPRPRTGVHGSRIAFAALGPALFEVVEPAVGERTDHPHPNHDEESKA
jgi:hypothetical protein